MKTTGRITLWSDCFRDEKVRHQARMRELQALQPKLAALQRYFPGLRERGIELAPENIGLDSTRRRRPAVRLQVGNKGVQLLKALLDLGFRQELTLSHDGGRRVTTWLVSGTARVVLTLGADELVATLSANSGQATGLASVALSGSEASAA